MRNRLTPGEYTISLAVAEGMRYLVGTLDLPPIRVSTGADALGGADLEAQCVVDPPISGDAGTLARHAGYAAGHSTPASG